MALAGAGQRDVIAMGGRGEVGEAQKPRGWESEEAVLTSPGSRAARQ